jgi:hypothetical protein
LGKKLIKKLKKKTTEFKDKAESVSKSTLQKIKDYIKKEEQKDLDSKKPTQSKVKTKTTTKKPTKRKVVVKKKEEK